MFNSFQIELFIIMSDKATLPVDCAKIIERLFVFVDTKDIELNRSLNIVVNPEIIKILFKQVEA